MSRLKRIVLAAVILAAALSTGPLAFPSFVAACSCMVTGPEEIGTFGDKPEIVVFVGTVQSVRQGNDAMGHTQGDLAVELVFKGDVPSARMPVIGGGGGDCTIGLEAGQRMVTAASLSGGAITPGLCMPYGDPRTPEGQELIAAAVRAYGPGRPPPDAPPLPTDPPASPTVGRDLALPLILVFVIGVSLALFGSVFVLARRGRPAP